MAVLIDSSFLLAVSFPKDLNHKVAADALRNLKDKPITVLPVVLEVFQITAVRLSYEDAIKAFALLHSSRFQIEMLNDVDMTRMRQIMTQYRSAKLDFADTAILALAERLKIAKIYTFDRRDFSIFRPTHVPYLELLP